MKSLNKLSKSDLIELLNSLEEISSSLNTFETLKKVMNQACSLLNAEGASIFLVNEESGELSLKVATNLTDCICEKISIPKNAGIAGLAFKEGKEINISDVSNDVNFYSEIDEITRIRTKSCLAVPLIVENKKIGTVEVINKKNGEVFNSRDILLLSEFSSMSSIIIDKVVSHEKIVESEKIEADLELASSIQKKLLPEGQFQCDGICIHGFYKPARFVSGDYYDYFKISDNKLFFIIGDVSGKGAQASLLMSSLKSYFRAAINNCEFSLSEMINKANKYFYEVTSIDKFVTLFIGVLNIDNLELTYVNAGHDNPIIIDQNKNNRVLDGNDLILGIDANYNYSEHEESLKQGDTILIYTDGFTEAMNDNEEMFGRERIINILKDNISDAGKLLNELPQKIEEFVNGAEQSDDLTFLLLKVI